MTGTFSDSLFVIFCYMNLQAFTHVNISAKLNQVCSHAYTYQCVCARACVYMLQYEGFCMLIYMLL